MTQKNAQTQHTPFRNIGHLSATCDSCGWSFRSDKQSSMTAAAKRHIDKLPDHRVTTRRRQEKVTYANRKSHG